MSPFPSPFRVLVAALAAGLLLTGCTTPAQPSASPTGTAMPTTTPSESTTPSALPTTTASPSGSASASGTTAPGAVTAALVYFAIDGPNGARLVREPHDVAAGTPARGAVEAMIAGPDDPDYSSTWNEATRVLGISDNAGVVTVDLSGEARTANAGSEFAALMKQQLIWTVTEQLGADKRVMLHIDGQPAGELWGVVDWTAPEARADWLDTLLLVSIDNPAEGDEVTSPVTISGQAAVFEATLPWRILDADDQVVQQGVTNTAEGQTMAPYSFQVTLPPGEYTVEVTEDDPSAGAGGALDVDDRDFTVTG